MIALGNVWLQTLYQPIQDKEKVRKCSLRFYFFVVHSVIAVQMGCNLGSLGSNDEIQSCKETKLKVVFPMLPVNAIQMGQAGDKVSMLTHAY